MRILQISSARTYGGGERHVVDLCRGLSDRGHEVFAALRPTCNWRERLSFLPESNILTVSIRNSFGVLSAIRIAEFVRENNIDIIHAHVARDYIPASIACMAAKKAKLVITRHVLFPLKPFNKFALKNVDRAIAVSDPVATDLKKIFAKDKVKVIWNGLDIVPPPVDETERLKHAFRTEHNIPADAFVIGSMGELKELKGQRDLTLAAPEILRKEPNTFFVIAGEDHSTGQTFRRELKRLVSVLNLEDHFLWLNWLEDTRAFFAAIDLFVSSSHSESFGLAILEAMALSKPVAASMTEGAALLINDKEMMFKIKDPVDLAKKVVNAATDKPRLAEVGNLMRQRAMSEFSLERMVDKTEELYREIL